MIKIVNEDGFRDAAKMIVNNTSDLIKSFFETTEELSDVVSEAESSNEKLKGIIDKLGDNEDMDEVRSALEKMYNDTESNIESISRILDKTSRDIKSKNS